MLAHPMVNFCLNCQVKSHCVNHTLSLEEEYHLQNLVSEIKSIEKNEIFVIPDTPLENIYAVHDGLCKESFLDESGHEYINEFYFPGDFIGLELLNTQVNKYTISALSPAQICIIPLTNFYSFIAKYPNFQKRILHLLCNKFNNASEIYLTTNAKTRVAALLLNIEKRLSERGYDLKNEKFQIKQIHMSQRIGIANETLNRILKQFATDGLITFENHIVTNIEKEKLANIVK